MPKVLFLFRNHNQKNFAISCSWLSGLVTGMLTALKTVTTHFFWTQSLHNSDLSVVGFLAFLLFPYLLSTILFRVSMWKGVLPLVFLKAFSFSWCATTIIRVFHHGGWLLRILLLFSSSLTAPLLLWFLIRNSNRDNCKNQRDLLFCLILTLIIGCIDCSLISPFGDFLLAYF